MGRPLPQSIEHLADAISKLPVRIEKAILFGSRARGDYMKHSDWDVIIVSKAFDGISFPERPTPLLKALTVSDVELFCYTPEEFEKRREGFGIISVAVKEGIDLMAQHSGDKS
jgi:hypothetical protein